MNHKKIAFITCVNDEEKYAECKFYLSRLNVPEGYVVDVIRILEAPSMASGYNTGMQESDAKYKIYLHQDVFILNIDFLSDILRIFSLDDRIGMLGVIGKRKEGTTALEMSEWDVGSVIYDYQIISRTLPEESGYEEVASVDGLLIATQYDIVWRADIFDGWDFYDFSQCAEFIKRGYKVVVPFQEKIWCCHDGQTSNLSSYFDYYECFLREYGRAENAVADEKEMLSRRFNKVYAQKMVLLKKSLEELFDAGGREALRTFFHESEYQNNVHLREYRSIVYIDQVEEQQESARRLWENGMSALQLLSRFRSLKYALKRIEYGVDEVENIRVWEKYSGCAVKEVCDHYITDPDIVYRRLMGKG